MAQDKISVAFICTGNICRSPMAEAIFAHKVKTQGLEDKVDKIDSFATTGWEVGSNPDSRTVKVCKQNKIPISHKAKQIKAATFKEFDYLIGMDEGHLTDLKFSCVSGASPVIKLMGDWRPKDSTLHYIVEDPWYGTIRDFEYCYKQLDCFIDEFIARELGSSK